MSDTPGSTVLGTPGGNNPPPPPPNNSNTPAPPPEAPWHQGVDEGAIGWAKTRGYKLDDPAEAARQALVGHYNAEKLIGLDRAGRTVALPKDDAPKEEWDTFHAKLGRPADVKGYKVPEALKDDPVAAAFLDMAHKSGYTQKHLDPVFEFVGQQTQALAAQAEQQREQKAQADVQALQQEWGDQFQLRTEAARRARRELGLSDEQGIALEQALGVKSAADLFYKIGKGLMEDKAEGMTGASGGRNQFGLSPTEARAKIGALKADTGFAGRLLKGDATAKKEWDDLHVIAYPS